MHACMHVTHVCMHTCIHMRRVRVKVTLPPLLAYHPETESRGSPRLSTSATAWKEMPGCTVNMSSVPQWHGTTAHGAVAGPVRSNAVDSAARKAARSSSRGSGLAAQWAGLFPWECRAGWSRQAHPEEAQAPGLGTARRECSVAPDRALLQPAPPASSVA